MKKTIKLLSLCLAAVLVATLTIVPNLLASGGVVLPVGLARIFGVLDIVGELMLAALAIVFIFKIERDSDRLRRCSWCRRWSRAVSSEAWSR